MTQQQTVQGTREMAKRRDELNLAPFYSIGMQIHGFEIVFMYAAS